MNFNMKVSERCFNTILTALRFEYERAKCGNDELAIECIEEAIGEIDKNTYVANVMNMD